MGKLFYDEQLIKMKIIDNISGNYTV